MQRISCVYHHRKLIGEFALGTLGKSFRVRAVMDALGVEGDGAGIDVVAREKISGVIKKHFIKINVRVEKGYF